MSLNPGFAGRCELPDEYYTLFSRLTMFYPDYWLIAQVMLHAEGLGLAADKLSKSLFDCLQSCKEKMSKQHQYDFGMRGLKVMIKMSGGLLRAGLTPDEAVKTAIFFNFDKMCAKEDAPILKE